MKVELTKQQLKTVFFVIDNIVMNSEEKEHFLDKRQRAAFIRAHKKIKMVLKK